jgi:hypothetical protein
MKIEIEHDDLGNIRVISIPVGGSKVSTSLKPAAGWKVIEVEAPFEISHYHAADLDRLRDIRQNFRVQGAKLVRRST